MRYQSPDASWNSFLERLNDAVSQEFDGDQLTGRSHPSVQVVGLPRSGTTLLMQTLAASGVVGYPSNIMAMFWRTPWVGARVQSHLRRSSSISFRSMAGRTPEPLDPHEFGFFWRAALGHRSNQWDPESDPWPPAKLRRTLDLVTSTFDAPTVYKNFYAPAHLNFLQQVGGQRYVLTLRPVEQVAASLYHTRRKVGTPSNAWLGIAPRAPWPRFVNDLDRVAFQAVKLQADLAASGIAALPETLIVNYADLCTHPDTAVNSVLNHIGAPLPSVTLPTFRPQEPDRALSRAETDELRSHLQRHLEENICG